MLQILTAIVIRICHPRREEKEIANPARTNVALVEPKMSVWRRILTSGNDQSLITTTGLDLSVFGEFKVRFEAMYSKYSLVPVRGKYAKLKGTRWRRRLINGEDLRRVSVGVIES